MGRHSAEANRPGGRSASAAGVGAVRVTLTLTLTLGLGLGLDRDDPAAGRPGGPSQRPSKSVSTSGAPPTGVFVDNAVETNTHQLMADPRTIPVETFESELVDMVIRCLRGDQ